MLDLVVIGAGLAGMSAASVAAQAGLRVRLIAKGMGATHWHAGTIDLLGYAPQSGDAVSDPLEAIGRMDAAGDHPYAVAGLENVRAALETFSTLMASLGLPYMGTGERNLLLPSPVGAGRPVWLAPEAQISGRLDNNQPMLIVGFEGMRDFYPKLVAENLQKVGIPARTAFLPMSLITERRDFNSVWLAEWVEQPATLDALGKALVRLAASGERIGLPAILGLHHHNRVLAQLRAATGAEIFEIPTLPPSVPGIRLHTALRRHLETMGVAVEIGMEVTGTGMEDDRITWVETATSARPLRHRSRHFLLASGGILGGGIDSDHTGRVWETIFNLPLTTPQQRANWFAPHFLGNGHPIFRGGVSVNRHFQPITADGAPVYANLWAAGGTLTGADVIHERSLEGIAIVTGMAAATNHKHPKRLAITR